jgi:mannose-6-phosphate isomerase
MHVGLKETLSVESLWKIVDEQNVETLIGLMHAVRLEKGQAVYIPPGVIHAIGEGMLIAEVQEPSDLSVFCEWRDFSIDGTKDGHLGLGFDVALTSIERQGRSAEDIESLITKPDTEGLLLPNLTGEYFTVGRYSFKNGRQGEEFRPGFAVVIVYEGENLKLVTSSGDGDADLTLRKGHTVVLPFLAGRFHFEGEGSVIIARPPSAHV